MQVAGDQVVTAWAWDFFAFQRLSFSYMFLTPCINLTTAMHNIPIEQSVTHANLEIQGPVRRLNLL